MNRNKKGRSEVLSSDGESLDDGGYNENRGNTIAHTKKDDKDN